MFGNLFGQAEEKQAAMKKKLATMLVNTSVADGAIKIEANAAREITNISIDATKLDMSDHEELEDLLLVAINRALEEATAIEAGESQKLIQDMLPPGMGDLFGKF